MSENLGMDSAINMVPSCCGGLPILLVDHDTISVTSLSSMLQLFSYNVTSVELARRALTMIEEQPKQFKLIIANIELPDIDTDSFLNALLEKDIPLILIGSEMTTAKASEFLSRGASLCLEKPVSMTDIKYLWQQAIDVEDYDVMMQANDANQSEKLANEKSVKDPSNNVETVVTNPPQTHRTDADPKGKRVMVEENVKKRRHLEHGEIEAFRKLVRMQRSGQSSLLGKRPLMREIPRYGSYEKRRNLGNKVAKMATREESKKEEEKNDENKANGVPQVKKRGSVWSAELHMKFTAALCALGEKNATPKSILKIMNVQNLTQRQVASHLQKFKAQVQRLSETTPKPDWKSTEKSFKYPSNYEYPFKASNLTQNLIASNSSWYALALKSSSTSSIKPMFPKQNTPISLQKFNQIPSSSPDETAKGKLQFCLGGKVNLNKLPLFSEMMNNKPAFQFCSAPKDTTVSVLPMAVDADPSAPSDRAPSSTSYSTCHVPVADKSHTGLVPAAANHNPYVPEIGFEQKGLVTPDENYYVPNLDALPSFDYVLDIDFSQMGFDPYAETLNPSGYYAETLNPSAYPALPGDYVPGTDVNQMGTVPCGESFLLPDDMTPNLASCGESYLPPDNMMPPETCVNGAGLVPCEEMYVPDLEDMFPSATSYPPEPAFAPMDSAPNTAQNVQDCSVTQVEGSGSPHMSLADISKFFNLSDLDEIEGLCPVEEIQDLDEFLDLVDKFMKDNEAP